MAPVSSTKNAAEEQYLQDVVSESPTPNEDLSASESNDLSLSTTQWKRWKIELKEDIIPHFACCFHDETIPEEVARQMVARLSTIKIPQGKNENEFYEEGLLKLASNMDRLYDFLPGETGNKVMKIACSQVIVDELIPFLFIHQDFKADQLIFSVASDQSSPAQTNQKDVKFKLVFEKIDADGNAEQEMQDIAQKLQRLSKKLLNFNISGMPVSPIKERIGEEAYPFVVDSELSRVAVLKSFKKNVLRHLDDFESKNRKFDLEPLETEERDAFLADLLDSRVLSLADIEEMERCYRRCTPSTFF